MNPELYEALRCLAFSVVFCLVVGLPLAAYLMSKVGD